MRKAFHLLTETFPSLSLSLSLLRKYGHGSTMAAKKPWITIPNVRRVQFRELSVANGRLRHRAQYLLN